MNVTSVKRIHQSDWQKVGIPFYRARDIVAISKGQKISEPIYISENKYKEFSEISGKVKINDLLVTGVGTIGVPLLVQKTPLYFKDGNIIWFQNNNQFNGIFLYNAFLTRSIQNFIKTTTGVGTVPTYTIITGKETPISFPKPKEQDRVATLLKTAENLITLQQRKLEQLKQLKKAMLQQLFVSKNSKQPVLRFKNFDSDWRQHSLEDISAKTYSGLTGKSKDDFGHGKARYITYLNVHNNEVAVSDGVEQIEVDSKQNKVLKGDLLFTISSEVPSEVALNSVWSSEAGTDIYLNSFCFGIRPKSNYVNSFFLTYYLRSPQMRKLIYPLAQGISRFNISKRSILALKINTPVLPEQISICKVLMHIDNLITYQQNKLTQLTTLKRYLLQKLFI